MLNSMQYALLGSSNRPLHVNPRESGESGASGMLERGLNMEKFEWWYSYTVEGWEFERG